MHPKPEPEPDHLNPTPHTSGSQLLSDVQTFLDGTMARLFCLESLLEEMRTIVDHLILLESTLVSSSVFFMVLYWNEYDFLKIIIKIMKLCTHFTLYIKILNVKGPPKKHIEVW